LLVAKDVMVLVVAGDAVERGEIVRRYTNFW
jgi:hypothetical protein